MDKWCVACKWSCPTASGTQSFFSSLMLGSRNPGFASALGAKCSARTVVAWLQLFFWRRRHRGHQCRPEACKTSLRNETKSRIQWTRPAAWRCANIDAKWGPRPGLLTGTVGGVTNDGHGALLWVALASSFVITLASVRRVVVHGSTTTLKPIRLRR